ncbi:LysR family transcriptional regulator [Aestuariibius sp. 2305UL40-4]|uniref:LysR family transcriptional regulator n=1 Tax=Aestuariibius violaceus TaxID=3234132 RepID=UPI00345E308B
MLDTVTLDQLRMLVAIDETGSFTAAAKHVQRAQSAVSHAIRTLEADIGVELFDRSQRKPSLTAAGEAVLAEARSVLSRIDHLKARARGMAAGMEGEVTFAVSVVAPQAGLVRLLDRFRQEFPTCGLRLFVEEVGGAPQLVLDGRADLGLVGKPSLKAHLFEPMESVAVGSVEIVAVARSDHPLASRHSRLAEADLQDHRQLVPTSRALPRYQNRLVNDVWEVADLGTRHQMILAGLGWGTMPRHSVAADLEAGRLVPLDISARPDEAMRVPLFAIYKRDAALGPARRWLVEQMEMEIGTSAPSEALPVEPTPGTTP